MQIRPKSCIISGRSDASGIYQSSGIKTFCYRIPFNIYTDAHSIQFVFSNRRLFRTVGECNGPNPVSIRALLETADGQLWPLEFGGSAEALMQPGGDAASDPLPITVKRGQVIFLRARPAVEHEGQRWLLAGAPLPGTPEGGGGAPAEHLEGPVGKFIMANLVPFVPAMVLGVPTERRPRSAVILGDSTAYGSGDRAGADGSYGFLARIAHGAAIPHTRFAAPALALGHILGEGPKDVMQGTRHHRWLFDTAGIDIALISFGNNDVHRSTYTLERNQAIMLRYLDFLAGCGLKVIACTITPRSTGDWSNLMGQQACSSEINQRRRAFNNWLLRRPHPVLLDVWDAASLAGDTADPDRWTSRDGPWTLDGTHMNSNGHFQMANALLKCISN